MSAISLIHRTIHISIPACTETLNFSTGTEPASCGQSAQYRGPVEPEPDTKDWTWTLTRRCDECGLAAGEVGPAEIAERAFVAAEEWVQILRSSPAVTQRPGTGGLVAAGVRRPRPRCVRGCFAQPRRADGVGGPSRFAELGPGRDGDPGSATANRTRRWSPRSSRRPPCRWWNGSGRWTPADLERTGVRSNGDEFTVQTSAAVLPARRHPSPVGRHRAAGRGLLAGS
jgi:hypothetical protein